MLEKQLIAAVNRPIPRTIYHHSNTGSSRTMNGIPDRYYDGPARDLWAEFKMARAIPRSGIVLGDLTEIQKRWLERRYYNSLAHTPNAIVVVGLPNRTAVIQTTPTEWREGSPITQAISLKEVSLWIADFCSQCSASSAPSSSVPPPSTPRTA